MIKKYDDFINEFYTGRYTSAGFKNYEPTDKFNFNLFIKYNPENEKFIKDTLAKYNISYDKFQLTTSSTPPVKRFFKKDEPAKPNSQKLELTFLSYNNYEATSIINSILTDLHENGIVFDPASIKIEPTEKPEKKPIGFQFPKKEEI